MERIFLHRWSKSGSVSGRSGAEESRCGGFLKLQSRDLALPVRSHLGEDVTWANSAFTFINTSLNALLAEMTVRALCSQERLLAGLILIHPIICTTQMAKGQKELENPPELCRKLLRAAE